MCRGAWPGAIKAVAHRRNRKRRGLYGGARAMCMTMGASANLLDDRLTVEDMIYTRVAVDIRYQYSVRSRKFFTAVLPPHPHASGQQPGPAHTLHLQRCTRGDDGGSLEHASRRDQGGLLV